MPDLNVYQGCWPLADAMKMRLKYTSSIARAAQRVNAQHALAQAAVSQATEHLRNAIPSLPNAES